MRLAVLQEQDLPALVCACLYVLQELDGFWRRAETHGFNDCVVAVLGIKWRCDGFQSGLPLEENPAEVLLVGVIPLPPCNLQHGRT